MPVLSSKQVAEFAMRAALLRIRYWREGLEAAVDSVADAMHPSQRPGLATYLDQLAAWCASRARELRGNADCGLRIAESAEAAASRVVHPTTLANAAWHRLFSTSCECGQMKGRIEPFCARCFNRLPGELMDELVSALAEDLQDRRGEFPEVYGRALSELQSAIRNPQSAIQEEGGEA